MKIAIVHDSFTQMGGAERVIDVLHEMFPSAPVYTLVFDYKFLKKYQGWDIRTSHLQSLYNICPKLQYLLLWIPWAVNNLDFSQFDVVISSSSGFVKNIRVPKNVKHICYCHTPPRFLWMNNEYLRQEVPFLFRPIVKVILSYLKKWDLAGSKGVTKFIANSKEVQKRIKEIYNRDSEVIYPPVNTEFWKAVVEGDGLGTQKNYFLIAGRLQPHKNNALVIRIFNELGLNLHVVGTGRQEKYLQSIAKPNIKFLGQISDEDLRKEYSSALGFIYPQVEDFGLMPLEAAACGTATIALAQGGALETVIPEVSGQLFNLEKNSGLPDREELKKIVLNWQPQKYKPEVLRQQAEKFSKEKFKEQIFNLIKRLE